MRNIKYVVMSQLILSFLVSYDQYKLIITIITCALIDVFLYHMECNEIIRNSELYKEIKESYSLRKRINRYISIWAIIKLHLYIITSFVVIIAVVYINYPIIEKVVMVIILLSSILLFNIDTVAVVLKCMELNMKCNYYLKMMAITLLNKGPYNTNTISYPSEYSRLVDQLISLMHYIQN